MVKNKSITNSLRLNEPPLRGGAFIALLYRVSKNMTLSQDQKMARNTSRNFVVKTKSCQLDLIYQEYIGPVPTTSRGSIMADLAHDLVIVASAIV